MIANTEAAEADPPLRICTLEHWPPFVDQQAAGGGFAVQVVNEALMMADIVFERTYLPWARAISESQTGSCDAISEFYYKPEREEWADYSDAYGELAMTLFTQKDNPMAYTRLADLSKYKIGLLRGASISPEFHQQQELQLTPLNSVRQGLIMVYSGRLDAFVTGEKAIRIEMHRLTAEYPDMLTRLKAVRPAIHTNQLFLGFNRLRKNNARIRQAFNKGLAQLKASGRYQQILHEQNMD